jgi:2'-5' RNA ligase
VRQFLAIDLPQELRARLGASQQALGARHAGWRWVRPAGIHLTLRFLGDVGADLDRQARPGWREAAAGCPRFRFRLTRLGCFPNPRRPRVLWVGVEELGSVGRLADLAAATERAAVAAGFDPERRRFSPHLTLARARREARGLRIPDASETIRPPSIEVEAHALTLFRSELEPSGARYTALESFSLA